MSSIQYLLKNNLLADLSYFSESKQAHRVVRIVLNSVTYNHEKKHYVFNYWEESMAKNIRDLKVKTLTVYGFKDFKKVQKTISTEDIFDFIDELKLISIKTYHPSKDSKIDFSKN